MWYIITVLLVGLLYLIISVANNKDKIISIDTSILSFYHQIQTRVLDLFFEFITWFGSLWVLFPLYMIVLAILFKNGYKYIFSLNIIFLGAVGTTYVIKYLMDRKRPDIFDTIGDLPFDPSFPSAHTTQVTIFSLILVFLLFEFSVANKFLYIFLIFCIFFFVINSRMYLQVHYFSDIVGGILVALVWFLLGLKFMGRGV